jgi:hypothetical protein
MDPSGAPAFAPGVAAPQQRANIYAAYLEQQAARRAAKRERARARRQERHRAGTILQGAALSRPAPPAPGGAASAPGGGAAAATAGGPTSAAPAKPEEPARELDDDDDYAEAPEVEDYKPSFTCVRSNGACLRRRFGVMARAHSARVPAPRPLTSLTRLPPLRVSRPPLSLAPCRARRRPPGSARITRRPSRRRPRWRRSARRGCA